MIPAHERLNAMSIDVEDWFQVSAFSRHIDRADWERMPCRVERNIERVLEVLSARRVKATFFTLAWIAERYPQCIRSIVANGHELASHGCDHRRVTEFDPAALRCDVKRARALLEDIGGAPVIGYRAPSFSIGRTNLWAHDILAESGYRYSSSIYPIAHDHYGMPEAPRFAHRTPSGLLEIPASTIRLLGRNLPASGGGYFRLLPYPLSRWALRQINRRERQAGMFYFHPWEIDPEQPRVHQAPAGARLRHYLNLDRMLGRIDRLLGDFKWGRIDEVFADAITGTGPTAAVAARTELV
jgi:polysaccharide deacetylase family protein (PEP-CTERM system associated)